MNLIISTVQQEKQRIDYMLVKYQKALAELPKGTIYGKKIISKYIGKKEIEKLKQQIDRRRHIETMIKSLLEEQKLAAKVLEGNL